VRVAIVHDWLTNEGGAEQVVLALHRLYPDAPIFTSVRDAKRTPSFDGLDVRTSYLQHWPLSKSKHQLYPTLRPRAFRSFDLSGFDVVISSSSAEAKNVIVPEGAVHICYCHTPIRYYWSDYRAYLRRLEFGFLNPIVRAVMPALVRWMRRIDLAAAGRVDFFVANSEFVAERIQKYYKRDSEVIYPPVGVSGLSYNKKRSDYLLSMSRLVPYKRVDLAVKAATELGLPLVVAGDGPELSKLQRFAGPSVQFLGRVSDTQKNTLYEEARALIFPAEEDFGIAPVEAMAAGCPVVLYGKGGATESVRSGKEGIYFDEQTISSVQNALIRLKKTKFSPAELHRRAEDFSDEKFAARMKAFVADSYKKHRQELAMAAENSS
jgi:glycosyltransferase involved in cell wall biosynthesis